ncbi:MAG: HAMP domain-containing histidine kinase [Candidatus Syntrophoarchaeum sp.]|nr:HAMP domain-containing histidine kinase [Candidatus Syntrophoarchaeum sp.]
MSDYQNTMLEIFNSDRKVTKAAINTKQLLIVGIFSIIVILELLFKIPLLYPVSVICTLWLFSTMIYSFLKNIDTSIKISHINFAYFALELALFTMIIHFLGSVVWIGAIFYLIAIVYANAVLSWRAGLIVAVASVIMYLGLFMLEAVGVIPHYELFSLDPAFAGGNQIGIVTLLAIGIGVFFLCMYAVSVFSSIIYQEEEMIDEKRAIISMLNHDLKNYLTLISGYHSLYATSDDPKLKRANAKIDENIKRIDEILTTAGLYSKIKDPNYEMKIERLNLGELIKSVIEKVSDEVDQEAKISFEANEKFQIMGDGFLLAACFENLILNAMRYGGRKLEVSIEAEGDAYRIMFRDYGPGIPDEMKKSVFNSFRTKEERDGIKGTGVGLALVKKIIKMHSGDIWIEDNPEGGAIFCIRLPKDEDGIA